MGKTVIDASDGPGFLVNRCNRPFGLEALRLLSERIASIETIDRICRIEGGFRMGPFELMDLVGVDTGFEVALSFYELSFGEPRWRPSPISARYVAAGLHGRKSGRGYYDYSGLEGGSGSYREPDPEPLPGPGGGEGALVISGTGILSEELRAAATAAGYEVRTPHQPSGGVLPSLIVECDRLPGAEDAGRAADRGAARMVLCAEGSLSALDPAGSAVGFHVLPPFGEAGLVELTRSESSSPLAAERAERLLATLGKHVAWVGDAPGLVLGRIVCQLINECAFALGEGVGGAADIDTGMLLGLSHPRGPLRWADQIGLEHVLGVLDALCSEYREERYRPAPELRRLVAAGRTGGRAGGFFDAPS
jgi:3-hydroxybutyryl-CoA dehydrogenase